jgi:pilus assembly protein Flp/PilA
LEKGRNMDRHNWCRRFFRDEDGPTAVEYAVMLAMIILVAIAGVMSVGAEANNLFGRADTQMKAHGIN